MSQHATAQKTSQVDVRRPDEAVARKVAPLAGMLDGAKEKIREELVRFRTCCADPRASK